MSLSEFGPAVDLERAKAHVSVHLLAGAPDRQIPQATIDTLKTSPWVDHQIDAGWVCINGFLQYEQGLAIASRESAKLTWQTALANTNCRPNEAAQLTTSLGTFDLWRKIKRRKLKLSQKEQAETVQNMQSMHAQQLDILSKTSGDQVYEVVGMMGEAICIDLLNRVAMTSESRTIAVPSQSWFDVNYVNPTSAFDVWQFSSEADRKIQVKTSRLAGTRTKHAYDTDIAVVFLADHWPGVSIPEISQYLSTAPLDDAHVLGAGESLQGSINQHFAKNQPLLKTA